jgi:Sulfotransferase domain
VKNILLFVLSKLIALLKILQQALRHLLKNLERLKFIYFEFKPRPGDIFIVTYPRSGTTWMQMILYQLTTNGVINFDHISQKFPYFEMDFCEVGHFNQFPSPRVFKTHLSSSWLPRRWPVRYIYVIRDGKDVAVSFYHFRQSHFGFRGDFATFFEKHFIRNGFSEIGSWFQHTAGWLNRRKDPNILYLSYEEMKTDLRSCLDKIADFCGFEIDPARLPDILHRCSFGFMKQYEEKFDPAMAATLARPVQLGAFIRQGSAGGWSEHFSVAQQAMFDRYFRKYLSRKIRLLQNFSMPHPRPMEVRR